MPGVDPDQRVGIKQDHLDRLSLNLRPFGVQSHVHSPAATAGSRISMFGRLIFRAGAGLSTVSRYRTPFRSMITGTPLSASSSASDSRSRTSETVYLFMDVHCTRLRRGGIRAGRTPVTPLASRSNASSCATEFVALGWTHARCDSPEGRGTPSRLSIGRPARRHARRQPLAGDPLAA